MKKGPLDTSWVIEMYSLPGKGDDEVKDWFRKRDIQVFHTMPRIAFVSPPDSVSPDFIPCFETGEILAQVSGLVSSRTTTVELIAHATERVVLQETLRNAPPKAFLRIPIIAPGAYDLHVITDLRMRRRFVVALNTRRTAPPGFLRLRIGAETLVGSGDTVHPTIPLTPTDQVPTVDISAPRAVAWNWSGVEGLLNDQSADLSHVARCLTEDLDSIRGNPGSSAKLALEAGAFGTITISVEGPPVLTEQREAHVVAGTRMTPVESMRLRWLDSLVPAKAAPGTVRPVIGRRILGLKQQKLLVHRAIRNDGNGR